MAFAKRSWLILAVLLAPLAVSAQSVMQPVAESAALGSGPYKAVMTPAPGLTIHTLYRPADLAAVTGKLPIVAWGEGACANEGNRFRWFLSEIASHGYLVLAVGPIGSPDKEIWRPDAPQPAIEASADPRVSTSIMWNSGLFPGETTMGGGKTLTKEDLKLIYGDGVDIMPCLPIPGARPR